jgi:hypothetical protein
MESTKKPGRPGKYGKTRVTRINCTLPLSLLVLLEADGNVSETLTRIAAAHYGLDLNTAA